MPLSDVTTYLVEQGAEDTLDYLLLQAYCELHDCIRGDCGCGALRLLDRCYRERDRERIWHYPVKVIQ